MLCSIYSGIVTGSGDTHDLPTIDKQEAGVSDLQYINEKNFSDLIYIIEETAADKQETNYIFKGVIREDQTEEPLNRRFR